MGKYKGLLDDIKEKQTADAPAAETALPPPLPRLPARFAAPKPAGREAEAGPSQRRQEQQPGVRPDNGLRRRSGAHRGQESPARPQGHGLQQPGQRPPQAVGKIP